VLISTVLLKEYIHISAKFYQEKYFLITTKHTFTFFRKIEMQLKEDVREWIIV